MSLVLGIIIDTFGELRDEEKKFVYDIENVCFVCGWDRETLEKYSEGKNGFRNHIKKDHYQWNYLFYIAYLKNKDKTDFTGLESYIWDQIENDEINWFPTHKALVLQRNKHGSHGEETNVVLESLKKVDEAQTETLHQSMMISKKIGDLEDIVKKYKRYKRKQMAAQHRLNTSSMSAGSMSTL